tara:strand:+ start:195 stop:377 length:183 start_codon:yes stop_codon:yes gene_type:complete
MKEINKMNNEINIIIKTIVVIFFTLPLWLVIYQQIKDKIRSNNNLKRIHNNNKKEFYKST